MKSKSCSNERQRALPLLMTPPLGKQEPNRTECKTRKVHTMCLCKHTHAKLIFTNNRCKHARAEMNSLNHKRTRKLKKKSFQSGERAQPAYVPHLYHCLLSATTLPFSSSSSSHQPLSHFISPQHIVYLLIAGQIIEHN